MTTEKDTTRQSISDTVLDELMAGCENPEDLLGDDGLFKELKRRLLEKALGAELTDHLGYEKNDPAGRGSGNSRNGHSTKRLKSEDGELEVAVPRDRDASFDPRIVKKGQTRIDGFDDKVISMYARGMSVREIRGHLKELYGVDVSPDLVSRVTDAVLEEVRAWQNRALESVYPVVVFDALRVKIRDEGIVRNKAVYLALAITRDGGRDVLGLWIENQEGAKFWLKSLPPTPIGGYERAQKPGPAGYPDRRRGRAQGLPRGHQRGLPRRHRPDLYRSPGAPFAQLLLLQGQEECRRRSQGRLSRRDGGDGRDPP
jgi:hypothetical protein